jgi:hypothetical protein
VEVGGTPPRWLDRKALHHAAQWVSWYHAPDPRGEIDPGASLAATLAAGGWLSLVRRPRRRLRPVLLLVDGLSTAFAGSAAWNPLPDELEQGLRRRGIAVRRGRFQGWPEPGFGGTGAVGRSIADDPQALADQQAVIVCGEGRAQGGDPGRATATLRSLARMPQAPLAAPSLLALTRAAGLRCLPAGNAGLARLSGHTGSRAGSRPDSGRPAIRSLPADLGNRIRVLLGDALPWARRVALPMPPVCWGLIDT